MDKRTTHVFTFTIGRVGDERRSVNLGAPLMTWIDESGRWNVHPDDDPQFVGIGLTLDLAILDHLAKKLGLG